MYMCVPYEIDYFLRMKLWHAHLYSLKDFQIFGFPGWMNVGAVNQGMKQQRRSRFGGNDGVGNAVRYLGSSDL